MYSQGIFSSSNTSFKVQLVSVEVYVYFIQLSKVRNETSLFETRKYGKIKVL